MLELRRQVTTEHEKYEKSRHMCEEEADLGLASTEIEMLRKQIESQERELEKLRTTKALKSHETTQQNAELSTLKMENQQLLSQVSILTEEAGRMERLASHAKES